MTGNPHGIVTFKVALLKNSIVLHYLVFQVCVIIHLRKKYDPFWMPTNTYEIKQSQDKKLHRIMKYEEMA